MDRFFLQVQRGWSLTIPVIGPSQGSEDEQLPSWSTKKYQPKRFFGWCCGCCTVFFWFLQHIFFSGVMFLSLRFELFLFFGGDFPGMTSEPQNFWGPELSNVSSRRMGDMETFFFGFGGVPCSGIYISIYLTSSSLTLWCLFTFHRNSRCLLFKKRWWGKGGMVLASIVGSGQVICKDFSTAGCTQIGTSSP